VLSCRRAAAVQHAIEGRLGRDAPDVETRGFGEERPTDANRRRDGSDNPTGRRRNRRVEVWIDRKPPFDGPSCR
jgi:outer membrane protein OmpA-like peptidoglycan-associated protein